LVGGVEDAPTGTDATAGYAVSASAHQRLTWGLPRSRTWRGWGTKGCKNWGCTTAFVGGTMGVCRKKNHICSFSRRDGDLFQKKISYRVLQC
jgi:hypothetical protein